jgi:hypothetical protein
MGSRSPIALRAGDLSKSNFMGWFSACARTFFRKGALPFPFGDAAPGMAPVSVRLWGARGLSKRPVEALGGLE